MRILKIIGIATISIFICAGVAVIAGAQQDKDASQMNGPGFMHMQKAMPDMMIQHMKDQLNLSEDQVAKLRQLFEENMKKMQKEAPKFRDFKGMTEEELKAMGEEHKEKMEEMQQKLAAILTKEQLQKLQDMRKDFGKFGPGRGFGPGFGPGNRPGKFMGGGFPGFMKELNLTDAQKKQIADIVKKYRDVNKKNSGNPMGKQFEFINMILTEGFNEDSVRQLFQDSSADMENHMVSMAKMISEIKAVLTADQIKLIQQKFQDLQKRIKEGGPFGPPMMGPPMFMESDNSK